MMSSMPILMAVFLVTQPTAPGIDNGPEEIAGTYFGPPETVEAASVINDAEAEELGPIALAERIGEVDTQLASCQTLRLQMTALIGDTYGSYSVHPDWVRAYKNCIVARWDEIQLLGRVIEAKEQALMSGKDAQSAVRVADAFARLETYRTQVENEIEKESQKQTALIAYYNSGDRSALTAATAPSMATPTAPGATTPSPAAAAAEKAEEVTDAVEEMLPDDLETSTEAPKGANDAQDEASSGSEVE
ncbi:hypothetical protein PB2503_08919 [Parvularcula bermudensis HTCC2503]|uniref:Uncharacterized protein n=1 Tax=Parvularcula bermudensis (strain ATCC BAA-594 / HTCC2503 / KCTC 12087) TaxID=314260 RepID=E0TCE7_PARBH|nr:hypothetical protein [Parvularcula bermudensis]ADM09837.1 hypothetical protein PB2503_08919 [Parvularcula bermudensis HTCC2503]